MMHFLVCVASSYSSVVTTMFHSVKVHNVGNHNVGRLLRWLGGGGGNVGEFTVPGEWSPS